MKPLKKSFILLLIVLTVIIGSWTFAPNLFTSDANVWQEVAQDSIHVGTGSNPSKNLKPLTANQATTNNVGPVRSEATNIILQSIDGGQTWQDISEGLPENEQPGGFFAGDSELYLQVEDVLYHSTSNPPVWEKVNVPDFKSKTATGWPLIAFNRSGIIAYTYQGEIYQKTPAAETWLPIHTDFIKFGLQTIFETSDGTVFLGYDRNRGLYKSADKGKTWKQVQNEGWVGEIVESEGVLIATGQKGIMRSTDNGENWEWVISEGGVGIEVENIDGGFAAISYSNITKSRRIRISMDGGKTWTAIDKGLHPSLSISSIKQVGNYLICGHPDGIFRSADMGKTWKHVNPSVDHALNFDKLWSPVPSKYDRRVFKLYVSNKVVYAVARNFGC
jgi:photosystem II stability/assembly factor-like uncharacterized protein